MPPNRDQLILLASLLGLGWLAMQGVHELGHVLGAWVSGGTVQRVVLDPLSISRTDVFPNPHPVVVTWAGPVLGTLLPVLVWRGAGWAKRSGAYLLRFWAGFCLVANGCYLAVGTVVPVGDAADLRALGQPAWGIMLFGVVGVLFGLGLWHRMGAQFGFGNQGTPPPQRHVWGVASATIVVFAVEWLLYRVLKVAA